MTEEITISIIICTYNRAHALEQTIASLASAYLPGNLTSELIIVDNASTDHTSDIARSARIPGILVHYIHERRRGKGYAYNTAFTAARGKVLLCTDDDIRLPHNWIQEMSEPILTGKFHALVGGVKNAPHLERSWMKRAHRISLASTEDKEPGTPEGMIGANMAFSREVLSRVPSFNPELGPGALGFQDDTLFTRQIVAAGFRVGSALDVAVEHHFNPSRLSRSGFLDRASKEGRSNAYVAHHWEHHVFTLPRLRLVKAHLRLAYLRLRNKQEMAASEGIPVWEKDAYSGVYFYKQYLIERRRPFNYRKYGLVKIKGILDTSRLS